MYYLVRFTTAGNVPGIAVVKANRPNDAKLAVRHMVDATMFGENVTEINPEQIGFDGDEVLLLHCEMNE